MRSVRIRPSTKRRLNTARRKMAWAQTCWSMSHIGNLMKLNPFILNGCTTNCIEAFLCKIQHLQVCLDQKKYGLHNNWTRVGTPRQGPHNLNKRGYHCGVVFICDSLKSGFTWEDEWPTKEQSHLRGRVKHVPILDILG